MSRARDLAMLTDAELRRLLAYWCDQRGPVADQRAAEVAAELARRDVTRVPR